MFPTRFLPVLGMMGLAVSANVHSQQNQANERPVFRDAASHDDLSNRLRQAQNNNPLANYRTSENPVDPSVANRPADIIENSDIISFNGLSTLVPKRAILAVPTSMQSRIGNHVHGHRIVTWKEFLLANRGWITQLEVTSEQAEGKQPFNEQTTERIRRSANVIVATYQGGPISVLPLREPEAEQTTETE